MAAAVVFAVIIVYLDWSVAALAYSAVTSGGGYAWIAVPCIAFVAFMAFLLVSIGRTVSRAVRDRHLLLVTLDAAGVTLHRMNPVAVSWAELTDASLEQNYQRSTTLLRPGGRDPAVSEAGGSGWVIDLRALAGRPDDLLAAIQARLGRCADRI